MKKESVKKREMKIRYHVIEAESAEELINAVNAFIDEEGQAWQPTGGIMHILQDNFFQALYRDI